MTDGKIKSCWGDLRASKPSRATHCVVCVGGSYATGWSTVKILGHVLQATGLKFIRNAISLPRLTQLSKHHGVWTTTGYSFKCKLKAKRPKILPLYMYRWAKSGGSIHHQRGTSALVSQRQSFLLNSTLVVCPQSLVLPNVSSHSFSHNTRNKCIEYQPVSWERDNSSEKPQRFEQICPY